MGRIGWLGLGVLGLLGLGVAQPTPTPKVCEGGVDRLIQDEIEQIGTPGVMVSVVAGGQSVLEKGYGLSSLKSGTKPGSDSIFTIGSLSKALTGLGVLVLVGERKLNLEEPISTYLPNVPPSWRGIKVEYFLAHSSGIPNLDDVKEDSFDATLRAARNLPLAFTPGTNTRYNNFNFAVMGQVIAKVSGQRYIDFMTERVFKPLKMNSTGLIQDTNRSVTGYNIRSPKEAQPVKNSHWLSDGPDAYGIPSGGLQSSAADLQKLALALESGKLLKPAATKALLNPVPFEKTLKKEPTQYTAAGFIFSDVNKLIALHKTGGGTGIGTGAVLLMVPSRNISVVILRNSYARKLATSSGELAAKVVEECFGLKIRASDDEGEDN